MLTKLNAQPSIPSRKAYTAPVTWVENLNAQSSPMKSARKLKHLLDQLDCNFHSLNLL